VPPTTRGRPALYCGPSCRPSQKSKSIAIEVLNPDESPNGRPAERTWTVRLRRGKRFVVIANGLGWPSASTLARELNDFFEVQHRRKDEPID
jgi:hypothetical protein